MTFDTLEDVLLDPDGAERIRRSVDGEWVVATESAPAGSPHRRARLLSVVDLAELPAPRYLLQDFIRAEGFNVLYGPSGVGKSFLALDWSLCVATGLPFYGREVHEPGPVVFIAAEGASGLYSRIDAWRQARRAEPDRFYAFPEAVNFYAGETKALVSALEERKITPSLIVVDTMARCLVGGEENSAKDVGLFIDRVDALARRFDAAVLIVHHTGKTGELERGSSALRGASDTMASLKLDGAGLKLTCEKQKDAAEFEPWRIHLAEQGESCLIKAGTNSNLVGPQESRILESVSASFGTDWVSATKVMEVSEVPKASVYRALKALVARDLMKRQPVGKQRKEYRVTDEGEEFVSSRLTRSHETEPSGLVSPPSPRGETSEGER